MIERSELYSLARKLNSAVADVGKSALPLSMRADIADMFADRDPLLPKMMESTGFIHLTNQ